VACDTTRRMSADLVVVRVPLLALDTFTQWAEGARAADAYADDEEFEAALAADRTMLRARLADLLNDELVRAAIGHASPDLGVGIQRWRRSPDSRAGRSAERSLVRYVTRMASRPTPFGLTSGYLLGEVEGEPALEIGARDQLDIVSRIDPSLLEATVRAVAAAAPVGAEFVVRPNPLLYRIGGRLRVAARGPRSNRPRLIALPVTPAIDTILRSVGREGTVGAAVAALVDGGAPSDQAWAHVRRLLANDVLIPARLMTVTGADPTAQAGQSLRSLPGGAPYAAIVGEATRALSLAGPLAPPRADEVLASLERLPVEIGRRRCVQIDSIRGGQVVLPRIVVQEARRAVDLLIRLESPREDPLAAFAEQFERRFATRSVPLLEALDPDYGIRLEGVLQSSHDARAARRRALLALIERGHRSRSGEVALTDEDLRALAAESKPRLPESLALVCTLLAPDVESVCAGDFSLLEPRLAGPTGARLFGRLCHGDSELELRVRRHLERESAAEGRGIIADVAAAPDTDWGLNVTHRPVLRDWEIECGGLSGARLDQRIELADLRVGIERGEVVLHSERLGCRVLPRRTEMLNFRWLALPASRFLELLTLQEAPSSRWSWGDLRDAPELPAVRHGRIVLAPRRWNATAAEVEELLGGGDAARFRRVQAWRKRRELPRFIVFEHLDNRLLVDLDNVLSVEAFLAGTRGADTVRIADAAIEHRRPLRGPDGSYAHEIAIAFSRPATMEPAPKRRQVAVPECARRFEPGSEWLFAKLYGPASGADALLCGVIGELRNRLRAQGLIDRWFFIRYRDPDRHLRIRFHGSGPELLGTVLPQMSDALAPVLAAGGLYRICVDTYEREIERYGGVAGVEAMERLAEADSDAALAALACRPGALERRHLAVASVAALLGDAELDLASLMRCAAMLRSERSGDRTGSLGTLLAADERSSRARVGALIDALVDPGAGPPALQPIRDRSTRVVPILAELRERSEAADAPVSFETVLRSHAHMFVNRLLRSGGNLELEELRVHDALARLYESRSARLRLEQRHRGSLSVE
jgi:thiopeptide-type bacteriocin biosynthesis protein